MVYKSYLKKTIILKTTAEKEILKIIRIYILLKPKFSDFGFPQ